MRVTSVLAGAVLPLAVHGGLAKSNAPAEKLYLPRSNETASHTSIETVVVTELQLAESSSSLESSTPTAITETVTQLVVMAPTRSAHATASVETVTQLLITEVKTDSTSATITSMTATESKAPDHMWHGTMPSNVEHGFQEDSIDFKWCKSHNDTASCGAKKVLSGVCYDLEVFAEGLSNNIELVGVRGGQCVLWEKYDCRGKHSRTFRGREVVAHDICIRQNWNTKATSIKCCFGPPGSKFCDVKRPPKCKD